MLFDSKGKVLFSRTSLLDRETNELNPLLTRVLGEPIQARATLRDGIFYMPATLERSGEAEKSKKRERFPSLACGPDGRVYLVFTSDRDGKGDVFLRAFDGTKWSADRAVAATDADEYDACALVDRVGRIWVSWTSNSEGPNYNIFVASLANPSDTIAPSRITDADDDAMHARMACDSEGRIWVAYYKWHKMGQFSRDKEVYVRRYDGAKWSNEVRVSPTDVPTYEDHTDPAISVFRDGALIAWSWDYHRPRGYPQTASEPTIFVRSVGADLHLDRPRVVSGHDIDTTPAVAVDRAGRVWCAWDRLASSDRKSLCVCQRDLTSEAPSPKVHQQSRDVANVCTPGFAVSPKGKLTLVWAENEKGDRWVLKKADFQENEARWTNSETVISDGNPRFPSAAYDEKGGLWIAYSVETAAGREIAVKELPMSD
jgi:hypothetical protein